MRVAIVHYHLRRGGVTRVIANALAGLGDRAEVAVLSGEEPHGSFRLPATVVPGLGYADAGRPEDAQPLADDLKAAAVASLGTLPDIWHFHNHALGKNAVLPMAVHSLIGEGARVLLQFHDFAEDGRPANYRALLRACGGADGLAAFCYPDSESVHYATLNARDDAILAQAGIPVVRRHLLPNAVSVSESANSLQRPAIGQPFLLYPTRAIRRKNIGELMLMAAASKRRGQRMEFATTLAPENPQWLKIHDEWKAFGSKHRLPVRLAATEAAGTSFEQLLALADGLVTTSVAEGFGLAFLEPFLFNKSLVGRNLPDITRDFAANGLNLDNLYSVCPVELDARQIDDLRARIARALPIAHRDFDLPMPDDAVDLAFESMRTPAGFDFGRLDEEMQRSVIEQQLQSTSAFEALPDLALPDGKVVAHNAAVVKRCYGIAAYGNHLHRIYQQLLQTVPAPASGAFSADEILRQFTDPRRFNLLLC